MSKRSKKIIFHTLLVLIAIFIAVLISVVAFSNPAQAPTEENQNTSRSEIVLASKEIELEEVSLLFVGDIMLDRYIRRVAERESYDFILKDLKEKLNSVDLVIANLEGTITSYPSVSILAMSDHSNPNHYKFTFDPLITKFLLDHNIGVVNIGNNHILDFGNEGLAQTRENLKTAGIEFFGDPHDREKISTTVEIKNLRISMVSFNQFFGPTLDETLREIESVRAETDFLIVYPHWGEEYSQTPTSKQREWAHKFIDAGANMVIGAHPHVIQSMEIYKDAPIYYSLGNFIFDQYFSDEVRCGLILKVVIGKNEIIKIEESTSFLEKDGKTLNEGCKVDFMRVLRD